MHRIDTDTATENNMFRASDSSQGIEATKFNAPWCNAVQEELATPIEKAGFFSLSSSDNTQLWQLLNILGIRTRVVTSGSVALSDEWRGSLAIFCSDSDLTISGYFKRFGSILLVIPSWGDDSGESMTVSYGSSTVQLLRGQGLVAFVNDTSIVSSNRILLAPADGETTIPTLYAAKLRQGVVVDDNYAAINSVAGALNHQTIEFWKSIGQVRRFVNVSDSALTIDLFSSNGSTREVTIPVGGFIELIWLGATTSNATTTYACLYANV